MLQKLVNTVLGPDWILRPTDGGIFISTGVVSPDDIQCSFQKASEKSNGHDIPEGGEQLVRTIHPGALWEVQRMRKFHLSVRATWPTCY